MLITLQNIEKFFSLILNIINNANFLVYILKKYDHKYIALYNLKILLLFF